MLYELEKWNQCEAAEEAEAAVDEPPEEGDAAGGAGSEGEEWDAEAAESGPLENPLVADGILPWADEGGGDAEVREGEPVCAVGEEGVAGRGVGEGVADTGEPVEKRGGVGVEMDRAGDPDEPCCFVHEGERGNAAEDKAGDDDREVDADAAEGRLLLAVGHACLWGFSPG